MEKYKHNIAAVILNWNAAEHTVSCIETCFQNNISAKYILVDNDSSDDSLQKIEAYLTNNKISFILINESEIPSQEIWESGFVIVLKNKKNYGYAGGNNRALQLAMHYNIEYFWILNNDATVNSSSLPELLTAINTDSQNGFAGSVLCYADRPEIIQACGGGKIYPYLGKSKLFLKNVPLKNIENLKNLHTDYLMGASLLVKRKLADEVGLMDENYFMYYEEADWQKRAAEKGWKIIIAEKSIVLHGDSASTKNSSHMFHYYRNRAAIIFTKKFYGYAAATVAVICLSGITVFQNRKSLKNIFYALKGVLHGYIK